MASSKSKDKGKPEARDVEIAPTVTGTGENQVTVHWNIENLFSAYANVSNVHFTREEVTVLFGTNQNFKPEARELWVELTNRVIVSPYTAKRLKNMLEATIAAYEDRHGKLPIHQIPSA